MEYKKIDKGSYNIHLIKTDNFKEVVVKIYLKKPIKREDITMRNILTDVLTYSTKTYNTNKLLNIREQELYASNITVNNYRFGNYLTTVFSIDILNDKYTEKGNAKEAIELLSEVMYNPDVESRRFNPKVVNIIKKDNKEYLERLKENTSLFSAIRLSEEMDKKRPSSLRMCGYLEDLKDINVTNLYNHYKDMIDNSMMDVYVVGDINFLEMEKIITTNFSSKVLKKKRIGFYLEEKKALRKPLIITEKDDHNQSKLTIGCRIKKLTKFEEQYVLPVYNLILGGSTGDSKLFKIIREKYSYAYYIYSSSYKLDHTLLIRAGISKENLKNVIRLVDDIMIEIKRGHLTEKDIKKSKAILLSNMNTVEENPYNVINMYYSIDTLGEDDIKTAKKMIKKVTKRDIIALAKKIKMDTIYCLEGDAS